VFTVALFADRFALSNTSRIDNSIAVYYAFLFSPRIGSTMVKTSLQSEISPGLEDEREREGEILYTHDKSLANRRRKQAQEKNQQRKRSTRGKLATLSLSLLLLAFDYLDSCLSISTAASNRVYSN
jgi:hypothetical protein